MISPAEIDALLPQTQCGDCGYKGCRPYAEAMALKLAPINLCPPGGEPTLQALGTLLNIDPKAYPLSKTRAPSLAVIREAECIGCTKCIQACPVDAIMGAAKLMHSVITDDCTGCGLCVEPCPVDCIDLIPIEQSTFNKDQARAQFAAKEIRTLRKQQEKEAIYQEKRKLVAQTEPQIQDKMAKQAYILEALQRSKAKTKS